MDRMPLEPRLVRFGWDGRLVPHPAGRFWLWQMLRAVERAGGAGADPSGGSAPRGAFIRVQAAWQPWWLDGGVELALRVTLVARQRVRIPHDRPVEPVWAVARLVRAWPKDLRVITGEQHGSWAELGIELRPHPGWLGPGLQAEDIRVAEAVAWTAAFDILRGKAPARAVRDAHRDPLLELLDDEDAWLSAGAWFLTRRPPRVDLGLGWLFAGTGRPLAERVASDAPDAWVDGFRLGRLARRTLPAIQRMQGVLAEMGGHRQRGWVVVGALRSSWGRNVLHDGVVYHVQAEPLPAERPGGLEDGKYRRAVATVLRAWPAGEKALLLPDPAVRHGAARVDDVVPIGWLAVRKGRVGAAATADLFRAACRMASQGVPLQRLGSWIESLSPQEVEGVIGLHKLTG